MVVPIFQFEITINVSYLVLPPSFEYLCYGSKAIINILLFQVVLKGSTFNDFHVIKICQRFPSVDVLACQWTSSVVIPTSMIRSYLLEVATSRCPDE